MQWQVRCLLLFFAMPGLTVNTCSATAPGCVGRFAHVFYAKGNSDPEVFSVLLFGMGVRVTLNGEVCTDDDIQCFLELVVAPENWTLRSRTLCTWQFVVSLLRCCLRSWVDFLGALDDSQL